MNKSELIRAVHERMDKKVSLKELDGIVDAILAIMSDKLKAGEEVQLADFGTFAQTKFAVKPAEIQTRKKKG
jgi:nucleoid DNA-binding protein